MSNTKPADYEEDGDNRAMLGKANATASTSESALIEALASLSREFKTFKQEVRQDLSESNDDIKTSLRDDFVEFKGEVLQEIHNQNVSIAEAQTRIADLESARLEMKEMLLDVVKDKLVDLEK